MAQVGLEGPGQVWHRRRHTLYKAIRRAEEAKDPGPGLEKRVADEFAVQTVRFGLVLPPERFPDAA